MPYNAAIIRVFADLHHRTAAPSQERLRA